MSDVKRWSLGSEPFEWPVDDANFEERIDGHWVIASDHDRVVAERNAQIHYRDNVIAQLRAELEGEPSNLECGGDDSNSFTLENGGTAGLALAEIAELERKDGTK